MKTPTPHFKREDMDWEDMFENFAGVSPDEYESGDYGALSGLKDFIQITLDSALEKQRAKLVKAVEEMKRDMGQIGKCKYCGEVLGSPDCECHGFNLGVDAVLTKLRDKESK